jgi:hypothetical protein
VKILAVFAQNYCYFLKKMFITFVFEKNANFFPEKWQKSPKTVIITSDSGTYLDGVADGLDDQLLRLKVLDIDQDLVEVVIHLKPEFLLKCMIQKFFSCLPIII